MVTDEGDSGIMSHLKDLSPCSSTERLQGCNGDGTLKHGTN